MRRMISAGPPAKRPPHCAFAALSPGFVDAAHGSARRQRKEDKVRSGRALLAGLAAGSAGRSLRRRELSSNGQAPLRRVHPGHAALPRPDGQLHRCGGKNRQPFRFRRQARAGQPVGHLVRAVPPARCRRSSGCKPGSATRSRSWRYPRIAAAARPSRRSSPSSGSRGQDLSRSGQRGRARLQGRRFADQLSDRSAGTRARPGRRRGGMGFAKDAGDPRPLLARDEVIKTSFPQARP